MSPAPTKTGSAAGSGAGVALGAGVIVGARVALGGALGRAVGAGLGVGAAATASCVGVGRQALGVVASGWPQPAAAISSANMSNLGSRRCFLIDMSCIV